MCGIYYILLYRKIRTKKTKHMFGIFRKKVTTEKLYSFLSKQEISDELRDFINKKAEEYKVDKALFEKSLKDGVYAPPVNEPDVYQVFMDIAFENVTIGGNDDIAKLYKKTVRKFKLPKTPNIIKNIKFHIDGEIYNDLKNVYGDEKPATLFMKPIWKSGAIVIDDMKDSNLFKKSRNMIKQVDDCFKNPEKTDEIRRKCLNTNDFITTEREEVEPRQRW
jgi:hypothetical protein